jgi:GNAT superfamily N-acetyltransferase
LREPNRATGERSRTRARAGWRTGDYTVSDVIQFATVSTADDVDQILVLQARNLPSALTPEAMAGQGFVTVRHDPSVLLRMNDVAPAVIARAAGQVVGYALVMTREFAVDVPVLGPLFAVLDTLAWKGAPLRDSRRWFVMGQVCVADGYRGTGIFEGLYRAMAERYGGQFDFTVTEVAARNTRSLRAHARVGFQTLHVYPDATTGEEWHVVALDLAVPPR